MIACNQNTFWLCTLCSYCTKICPEPGSRYTRQPRRVYLRKVSDQSAGVFSIQTVFSVLGGMPVLQNHVCLYTSADLCACASEFVFLSCVFCGCGCNCNCGLLCVVHIWGFCCLLAGLIRMQCCGAPASGVSSGLWCFLLGPPTPVHICGDLFSSASNTCPEKRITGEQGGLLQQTLKKQSWSSTEHNVSSSFFIALVHPPLPLLSHQNIPFTCSYRSMYVPKYSDLLILDF